MQPSLEEFLSRNLRSANVPEDFVQRVQRRIRTAPSSIPIRAAVMPRWALATAAGLSILALLGGFETGRSLSVPKRQPLPLEQSMLLLNQ